MCRPDALPARRARSEAVLSPRILGGCLESARALLGDRVQEGNGAAKIRQSDGRNDALFLQRTERVEDKMVEQGALLAFAATLATCIQRPPCHKAP